MAIAVHAPTAHSFRVSDFRYEQPKTRRRVAPARGARLLPRRIQDGSATHSRFLTLKLSLDEDVADAVDRCQKPEVSSRVARSESVDLVPWRYVGSAVPAIHLNAGVLVRDPKADRLVVQMSDMLDRLNLTEDWFGILPSRLGRNTTVDKAALALFRATDHAFQSNEVTQQRRACAYIRAMESVRKTLVTTESTSMDDLALAVALLACVECVMDCSKAMFKHMIGICDVLTSPLLDTAPTEFSTALLYWHWIGTFHIPVAFGRPSNFDTPKWLQQDAVANRVLPSDPARLRKCSYQLFIRLPRLIAQLRNLRESRSAKVDPDVVQSTIDLAQELRNVQDAETESTLMHKLHVKGTPNEVDRHIIPFCFSFSSLTLFQPLIYYWLTRILLNRILIKLQSICPDGCDFGAEDLRTENIRMTTNICMSWPYASIIGRFGSWAMCLGWITVWSAITHESTFKGHPTTDVKAWILQCCGEFSQTAFAYDSHVMDEAADLLIGGPLKGCLVDVFS
jgi:hypothetical protein